MWKRPCRRRNLPVISEIAKAKTNKSIAERINRCMMTEIGKSERIFGKILQRGIKRQSDCGGLNLFSMGATSGITFNEARL